MSDDLKSLDYEFGGMDTMKKEELLELGLSEEQASEIFKMRGKEIEKTKVTLSSIEEERDSLSDELNSIKDNFLDPEVLNSVKEEKIGLEKQLEDMENKYKEELYNVKFNHKLDDTLVKSGARDVSILKKVIDKSELKLDEDGNVSGIDEQLNSIKESHDYLFKQDDDKGNWSGRYNKGSKKDNRDPFLKGLNL